ncbi:MAG: DUF3047 domain-containing protein [Fibrobacter sp.]|nr:DUF3047 domain-containing protein [Fibrobacter sp.]
MNTFTRVLILFFIAILLGYSSNLFAANRIIVDTFSGCTSRNGLPCGWKVRHKTSNITVNNDSGNYFLTIKTEGSVTSIGKRISVNLKNYPVLHWKWRAHQLPSGGNESIKKKDDSGGGIYVIFEGFFPSNKIIKYVWSSTLQVGTITYSPYNHDVAIIVVQSGTHLLDRWVNQIGDVAADFKRAFHSKAPKIGAIALESDSDNTHSDSWIDFDDLYFAEQ